MTAVLIAILIVVIVSLLCPIHERWSHPELLMTPHDSHVHVVHPENVEASLVISSAAVGSVSGDADLMPWQNNSMDAAMVAIRNGWYARDAQTRMIASDAGTRNHVLLATT